MFMNQLKYNLVEVSILCPPRGQPRPSPDRQACDLDLDLEM